MIARTARQFPVIAALVVVLALAPIAFAGKPGGGGGTTGSGSTITGPIMKVDNNGNGLPNYGDSLTFNISTSATSTPTVGVRCYQNGAWVYDDYLGFYSGGYWTNPWFTLTSSYWNTAAAASCTARLFYYDRRGREQDLASLTFSVAP